MYMLFSRSVTLATARQPPRQPGMANIDAELLIRINAALSQRSTEARLTWLMAIALSFPVDNGPFRDIARDILWEMLDQKMQGVPVSWKIRITIWNTNELFNNTAGMEFWLKVETFRDTFSWLAQQIAPGPPAPR